MAATNYTPAANDAAGPERLLTGQGYPTATEEEFDEHNAYFATARFVYKPMGDDLLFLLAQSAGMIRRNFNESY
jgi:hypothetical protein